MDTNKPAALRRRPFGSPYILFERAQHRFSHELPQTFPPCTNYPRGAAGTVGTASLRGLSSRGNHDRRPFLGKLPLVRLPVRVIVMRILRKPEAVERPPRGPSQWPF